MKPILPEIDIQSRKAVVAAWLEQNIRYARSHVKQAVNEKSGTKVRDWETWRSFSEHALGELNAGVLDIWLVNMDDPNFDPTLVDEAESTFGEL